VLLKVEADTFPFQHIKKSIRAYKRVIASTFNSTRIGRDNISALSKEQSEAIAQ